MGVISVKKTKPALGWLCFYMQLIDFIGRDGVIRTHDPLHPMQVRYQAALRPEPLLYLQQAEYYSVKPYDGERLV